MSEDSRQASVQEIEMIEVGARELIFDPELRRLDVARKQGIFITKTG